jgi:hypothetical protein
MNPKKNWLSAAVLAVALYVVPAQAQQCVNINSTAGMAIAAADDLVENTGDAVAAVDTAVHTRNPFYIANATIMIGQTAASTAATVGQYASTWLEFDFGNTSNAALTTVDMLEEAVVGLASGGTTNPLPRVYAAFDSLTTAVDALPEFCP